VTIVRVALPVPLRQHFDYELESDAEQLVCIGARVLVPFGRRQLVGIVWQLNPPDSFTGQPLKKVTQLLDPTPVFDNLLRDLLSFAADYYHHPLGDVLTSALPALLREGRLLSQEKQQRVQLTAVGLQADSQDFSRSAKQLALWQQLCQTAMAESELLQHHSRTTLNQLIGKGLAEFQSEPFTPFRYQPEKQKPLPLNPAQALAVATVVQALDSFSCLLLEGVTGSGKTEVYLQAIQPVLAKGQQVLVLVPEIGLTPQTLARFEQRFAVPMLTWHSNMNDGDRLRCWQRSQSGDAAIIIGTRSALFLPFLRLGLLIIDEEHDQSFKQQDGFRYHARDLAIKRASLQQCPILLGSATPSLESLYNVQQKKFQHLSLPERATSQQVPSIELLDLKQQLLKHGLADGTLAQIRHTLQRGQQVMLFLNRRGYAPALICHECGWLTECHHCSAFTTYHKQSRQLVCHHCGSSRAVPHQCGHCGSTQLAPVGQGTEQLEEQLSHLLPGVLITRLDRDSIRRKGSLEAHLATIQSGEPQLIIGTQMLAKGHHFPAVSLVVVVDVDGALYSSDFRASEQLAQLLTQVSGRAGRGDVAGKVLLQTHYPGHPLLQDVIQNGYASFARSALRERQQTRLPPYLSMALFRAEADDSLVCQQFLQQLADMTASINTAGELQWLGPIKAPLERKAGKYRWQLQLFSPQRKPLHQLLQRLLQHIQQQGQQRQLKWQLDVDPLDLS
jgi:primosomal protein N' (replication factor Y)